MRNDVSVLRSEIVPRVATERVCGLPVLVVRGIALVREAVLARLGMALVRGAVAEGCDEDRARLELAGARETVGTPLEVVREGVELERYDVRGSAEDGVLEAALGVRDADGALELLRAPVLPAGRVAMRDGEDAAGRDELER